MIYAGTKDGTNYGFYLEKKELVDYVELTNDEHMVLINGQCTGKIIVFHQGGKPTLENQPEPTIAERAQRRTGEITRELEAIDATTTRPLRAVLAGIGTAEDQQRLVDLESDASALREELRRLQGGST